MRIILALLSILTLCDGRGGSAGGGRGGGGARGGVSGGARGSSSSGARASSSSNAARGSSSNSARSSYAAAAPRVASQPVRRPSSSSIGAPLLGFGAGALAGAFTANRINNAYAPVSYGGNNYYWGRDNVPQNEPNVCTRPLTDIDTVNFDDVMFNDGTRPVEFAWSCPASKECCDWNCCEGSNGGAIAGWIILGIAVAAIIALLVACIVCRSMKRRKEVQRSRQAQAAASNAWSPDLHTVNRAPPVFTATQAPSTSAVPPAYSNIVSPQSSLPDKPPAYSNYAKA